MNTDEAIQTLARVTALLETADQKRAEIVTQHENGFLLKGKTTPEAADEYIWALIEASDQLADVAEWLERRAVGLKPFAIVE